jgi:shikimate dehydrogenase
MPHKREAARACDHLEATATALGVVNTVWVRDGQLVGDSTDGAGFVDAAREGGVDLDAARVLVLGAGGAASAIVHAVRDAAAIRVWARRPDAATAVAALAHSATVVPSADLPDAVAASDVVVNATPVGMRGENPPFDVQALHDGQTVIDTVYAPTETPLLAGARRHGAAAINGLGMLVHQAARSYRLFTGRDAPLAAMWAAARDGA